MAVFTKSNVGVTEDVLLSRMIQDKLLKTAKLRSTITDHSAKAGKGIKEIDLPRWDTYFGETPDDVPADGSDAVVKPTNKTMDLAIDKIVLCDDKICPFEIPDKLEIQNTVDLVSELSEVAARQMGNYMDNEIIAKLRQADAAHLKTFANAASFSLADVTEARKLLNLKNVSEDERYLIIDPCSEKAMLDTPEFVRVDGYGSLDSRRSGEIGRLYGFTVIVHNGLNENEVIAYQKGAVAIAVQEEVKFESLRMDLKCQSTQYAFTLLWGSAVLENGCKQVVFTPTV